MPESIFTSPSRPGRCGPISRRAVIPSTKRLLHHSDGFDLFARDTLLLRHRSDQPCFYVGAGEPSVRMNKGHFKISDYVTKRIPLQSAVTSLQGSTWHIV